MRPLPRHVKFFLAGAAMVLVPIVLLFLLFSGLLSLGEMFRPSAGDTLVYDVKNSPDGSKMAVFFRNMGGGAAGWCYRSIDVLPANSVTIQGKEYVFRFNCQADVALVWESNDVVRIYYSDDRTVSSLSQRKFSRDGSVRILYSGK